MPTRQDNVENRDKVYSNSTRNHVDKEALRGCAAFEFLFIAVYLLFTLLSSTLHDDGLIRRFWIKKLFRVDFISALPIGHLKFREEIIEKTCFENKFWIDEEMLDSLTIFIIE